MNMSARSNKLWSLTFPPKVNQDSLIKRLTDKHHMEKDYF